MAIAIARRQCPHCRVSWRLRAKNSLGTMSCTQTVHRSHTTWEQLLNFFSLKLNWLINMFSVRSLPFYSRILFNLTKLVGNIDNMLLLEQSLKVSAASSIAIFAANYFHPGKWCPLIFGSQLGSMAPLHTEEGLDVAHAIDRNPWASELWTAGPKWLGR